MAERASVSAHEADAFGKFTGQARLAEREQGREKCWKATNSILESPKLEVRQGDEWQHDVRAVAENWLTTACSVVHMAGAQ